MVLPTQLHALYTEHSSYREKLLEHLFVGEIRRHLWEKGIADVEYLKPEVDNGGYDLVLASNHVIRHIQLKSSHVAAKASFQKVNIRLANQPSGCVIWVMFEHKSFQLGPFLWFGRRPNERLELDKFKAATHTKANATGEKALRPNIKEIPRSRFDKVASISELVEKLFGTYPTEQ